MDNPSDSRKYLAKYVEDLHSLVSHGLQPISHQLSQAGSADHPAAANFFLDVQQTLQTHDQRLSAQLDSLGTSPTTAVQDAAAGVAGFIAGIYNNMRTEAVSKSVRDDYTFISHCTIAWLMLMTTARSLGDHETEELAEQGYRDCTRLIMRIDELMPGLVTEELRQDGFAAPDVSAWAAQIVSGAWSRDGQARKAA